MNKIKLKDNHILFFIGENLDSYLGKVEILLKDNYIYLQNLIVRKNYREEGLGTILLKNCFHEALSLGFNKIVLEANAVPKTIPQENLILFYQKNGFTFLNKDINLMEKIL